MAEKQFTAEQKVEALKRELRYRRNVYRGQNIMSPAEAKYQIDIFEEMLADYLAISQAGDLLGRSGQ
jgi:hypothetical protein